MALCRLCKNIGNIWLYEDRTIGCYCNFLRIASTIDDDSECDFFECVDSDNTED